MRIEELKDRVFLIADSVRPVGNEEVCLQLAHRGIDSLLVLDDNNTPFCFAHPGGIWCCILPLSCPEAPIPADLARIADFISYETRHNRTVGVWIGYDMARDRLVQHVVTSRPPEPSERPLPNSPCCCRPYHEGCHGALLCHGTSVDAVESVLQSGRLLSKAQLSGMTDEELRAYARKENVGDPPDHYRYVCLANGDCVAPDIVAASRRKNRFVRAQEADEDFYPAIRFFFETSQMFNHPNAEYDGICPVKIRDELLLQSCLLAVVVPEVDENGEPLRIGPHPGFESRIIRLDHREYYGLTKWSNSAFQAVVKLVSDE